jgi:tetrahydromethanopterin S-methyltransferase subunit E
MLTHHRDAIGFLLKHLFYGCFGGFLFGALLLWFDVAGLATMIFASPEWPLFLLMLFFGLFVTFGSIGMGVGVMGLGEERD